MGDGSLGEKLKKAKGLEKEALREVITDAFTASGLPFPPKHILPGDEDKDSLASKAYLLQREALKKKLETLPFFSDDRAKLAEQLKKFNQDTLKYWLEKGGETRKGSLKGKRRESQRIREYQISPVIGQRFTLEIGTPKMTMNNSIRTKLTLPRRY